MENENTVEQSKYKTKHLGKYQFKPGQSGNPSGRPKGAISMKQWAKNYLMTLPNNERLDFLNSLDPDLVWRMAEGNPEQKSEIKAEVNIKNLLDELSDSNTKEESK